MSLAGLELSLKEKVLKGSNVVREVKICRIMMMLASYEALERIQPNAKGRVGYRSVLFTQGGLFQLFQKAVELVGPGVFWVERLTYSEQPLKLAP
jgi:hypothetical protein